ncbi:dynamin family protein [Diaphorobacter sp. DS2]|uniref:dynamin family protein n=1 Tax=Diaphorobacter sp. ED-3 TaxID=3016636 RepID=UPI0010737D8D|nr:dynamin family protein [Diaphorobacter sp. ED-3]TFI48266.1 dynamin family protein [Diaphorobacter sp. DS2]
MGPSFNEQFDQHGAWRRAFAQQLKRLGQWMGSHDLMDAAVEERLQRLEEQVRSDKVTVAFVAEFSRGKSELINAIFFAGYGRRIMPASAGRTTMCPTELGYENGTAPSLRLLPIDTRMQSLGLAEWRLKADRWVKVPLDMDDPAQLAQALEKVSEVRRVSVDEARALGFWSDEAADENPVLDAAGMVEVPMWRHAVINIPHPLLKQGLVILDTPGLNAVGAEPELTINLIPQAHAVVFILGADTGVTRSDLTIWRDHLGTAEDATDARLVVLNKIDTLWDTLSSPSQVQAQLERQRQTSAELLGVPLSHVVPVSAQKGLVAKINCDDILLESSGLPLLEEALAEGIMGRRQAILRATVASGVASLQSETRRVINIRRRDLDDQMLELRSLRGKNASVIDAMRGRIEQEQQEFEASTAKIQAVRAVHLKMLREVFHQLGPRSLKAQLVELTEALQPKGLKLGVRKVYGDTFAKVRTIMEAAQSTGIEIQAMLGGTFRQLNTEFGFSLQVPAAPQLGNYVQEIVAIEQRHLQYVGMGNTLRLAQPEFAQRLLRAMGLRLRTVFESAANELELWSKTATAQLDAQLRERKRSFSRRIEAVNRIQQAANGLVDRIAEIEEAEQHLAELEQRLAELTSDLVRQPQAPEGVDIDIPLTEPQPLAAS